MANKIIYNEDDAGCYVKPSAVLLDKIVRLAEAHGFICKERFACPCDGRQDLGHPYGLFACDYGGGIEDAATKFMNDNFPVAGLRWGNDGSAGWGLWPQ